MRFADSIRLLVADANTQIRVLGPVPETIGVRDFVVTNSIYRMAWLFHRSFGVYDEATGNESYDDWLARTELPPEMAGDRTSPFWSAAERLWTATDMILYPGRPYLYTAHGLRKAREWSLIRYLALQTCEHAMWPPQLAEIAFETLWTELGDGLEQAWQGEARKS